MKPSKGKTNEDETIGLNIDDETGGMIMTTLLDVICTALPVALGCVGVYYFGGMVAYGISNLKNHTA